MRLAILIGLSQYKSLTPLPACANDLQSMKNLLASLDQYEEFLTLDSSLPCFTAKQLIIDFIDTHKDKHIDELFFYYSGHGHSNNEEFRYLWSDYDQSAINQTSLSNSEIDTLIKSLSPSMAFKVVDACHSGVTYIKDNSGYSNIFNKSAGYFKKCYFFFSSLNTQNSFASNEESHFTSVFLNSFAKSPGTKIRYRDIKDFISDKFHTAYDQTPFFIEQADNTEYFCTITDKASHFVNSLQSNNTMQPEIQSTTPIEAIMQNAELYCNENDATEALRNLQNTIALANSQNTLKEIFDINATTSKTYSDLPKAIDIARWIEKQKDTRYYITISKEKIPVTVIEPKRDGFFGIMNSMRNQDYVEVTRYEDHINSINPSTDQEYACTTIIMDPKFNGIPGFIIYVAIIISESPATIFYGYTTRHKKNWTDFEPDISNFSWSILTINIKQANQNKHFFKQYIDQIHTEMHNLLETKFLNNPHKTNPQNES